eukprot:GHVU01129435.1.p4 GENE.GHVU01129435.1~~GHVU01129435.1.p4  ORF type:complete len:141 (+),score=31.92 GHVU01129435.1:2042-2464(+)
MCVCPYVRVCVCVCVYVALRAQGWCFTGTFVGGLEWIVLPRGLYAPSSLLTFIIVLTVSVSCSALFSYIDVRVNPEKEHTLTNWDDAQAELLRGADAEEVKAAAGEEEEEVTDVKSGKKQVDDIEMEIKLRLESKPEDSK